VTALDGFETSGSALIAEYAIFLMMEMLAGVSTLHLAPPQIACKFDVKHWPARVEKQLRLV
jgi:hypothetical protein